MARGVAGPVLKDYRTLDRLGMTGDRTDEELLGQFLLGAGDHRELAFAVLVERHAPMVQRVCREVLRDYHESQDAAQATFLVLAIQARAIRRPGSLGAWLHGVALRVAARARTEMARRRKIERWAGRQMAAEDATADLVERSGRLHEAIDGLPARYKTAIVACYLEGLPHAEAARRLHLSVRTLETRLYRGRERLRSRLVRGGLTLAAVELADLLTGPSPAADHTAWSEATSQAAARISEGSRALSAGLVSSRVLAWARSSGSRASLVRAVVALAVSGLILGGSLVLASRQGGAPQQSLEPARPAAKAKDVHDPPPSQPALGVTIARPLPERNELQRILREVAREGIQLAREKPQPGSWTLAKIAQTQAKVGDRDGAVSTFGTALEEAGGRGTTPPHAHGL
jgi:RNA polymerase sigma factor (sigma-70 family)